MKKSFAAIFMKKSFATILALTLLIPLFTGCQQAQEPSSKSPEEIHRNAQEAYYLSIGEIGLAELLYNMSILFSEAQNLSLTKDGDPNPECILPLQDKLQQISVIYAETDKILESFDVGEDEEIIRIHSLYTSGINDYKTLIDLYSNCANIISSYETDLAPEAVKALYDDLSEEVNSIKMTVISANKSFNDWQNETQNIYLELTSSENVSE